jgi:hypothetical protein
VGYNVVYMAPPSHSHFSALHLRCLSLQQIFGGVISDVGSTGISVCIRRKRATKLWRGNENIGLCFGRYCGHIGHDLLLMGSRPDSIDGGVI